ncbi:NAD(P)H-dependent oxidoreductase [Pseudonocardia spinosispora]|uniref:NAD(P)H-dependent oxidoreductase n=1 Tax=Pseudonocardia spinosispora TaxID=103441 RepID=UPI001FDFD174|nr:NAD(P)H-dependent oxidoreductase [Pseudonocardia spinosispora]
MIEPMKVLWIYAHPESRSLNGSLRDAGIQLLSASEHEYRESDLYAMRWNPVVDAADFGHDPAERLDVLAESERAYRAGELAEDIRIEQEKIRWADTLVFQFPLWWFGPPAILKGWFDRIFVQGFAQGVIDPRTGRARRYGDGGLYGKRAMVVVTVGANDASTGPRGIHGDLTEVLFPLLHGTLWYSGMDVVEPFIVTGTGSDLDYSSLADRLTQRILSIPQSTPLPYRTQNSGDYDDHLVLKPNRAPGVTGLQAHYLA